MEEANPQVSSAGGNELSQSDNQQPLNPLSYEALSQEVHNVVTEVKKQADELKSQKRVTGRIENLTYLGFIIVIILVGTIIIMVLIFEVQFLDSNNKETVNLLQNISNKVNKL